MVNPEAVAAVFIIGGVGAAASYVVYRALDATGPELRRPAVTARALQAVELGFPKGE
jgi:hypothetical protein